MNHSNHITYFVIWRIYPTDVEVWECIKYAAYGLEARVFASIEEVVLE